MSDYNFAVRKQPVPGDGEAPFHERGYSQNQDDGIRRKGWEVFT